MKLAQAVGESLAALGVRHAFGVVGSGNFRVTEALRARGAAFVAARHETAAVTMADGYAALSGELGVATVHQGPGYTNAITGMVEAAKSHSPVLLLAADTPAGWTHSNFRIDQAGVATAGGIAVTRLDGPATAANDLARAWHSAAVERRATVLLMPLDVQEVDVGGGLGSVEVTPLPAPVAPSGDDLERATALIAGAQRPVIIAGRGALLAGARAELEALGERIGALLATSVVAHGLFRGHDWNIGISGGFATPLAAEVVAGADLVLAFGASLNRWTTRHGRLIGPGARIVQVGHHANEIGVHQPVDVGIVADARLAAGALAAAAPEGGGYRTPALAARIAASGWRDQPFGDASTPGTIDPRTLTIALDDLLPRERVVVVDGGHFSGWPAMYLQPPDERGFLFHQAYQSIGLGLGTAIGAALARPDRTVIAALGDGSAFMTLGELETAARLALPMIVLVYNDDAYGAEVHHFADEGLPMDTVQFGPTDLAAVGRAVGAEGVVVRGLDDLAGVGDWLAGPRDRPLVVDAKVTPTVIGAWLPEAFRA